MKPKKTITIPHPHHQPSKAELEEDLRIKSTPRKLVKAVVQDVDIQYKQKPKWTL
ncbi:MAG: hypothetical protein OXH88_03825 [Gammaproteobacteria bacterium]|nr:hypothetical protein [Gammaproteobacteria bacterium]